MSSNTHRDTDSSRADPDARRCSSWFFCCMDCFSDHTVHGRPDPSCPLYTGASLPADTRRPFRWIRLHLPSYPRYGCSDREYYSIFSARSTGSHQKHFSVLFSEVSVPEILLKDHSGWPHRTSWSCKRSPRYLPTPDALFLPPYLIRYL